MNREKLIDAIELILEAPENEREELLRKFLHRLKTSDDQRTEKQNNSLWLFMTILAETLNDMGLDQRKLLKPTINIPWTKDAIHDHLWVPIQEAMYGFKSTTKLKKLGQLDKVHEVLMRELGEKHGVEYIEIPNDPTVLKEKVY